MPWREADPPHIMRESEVYQAPSNPLRFQAGMLCRIFRLPPSAFLRKMQCPREARRIGVTGCTVYSSSGRPNIQQRGMNLALDLEYTLTCSNPSVVTNKVTMKIGALAKRTGLSVYTIRYYERIGLLPRAFRGRSKQREYNPSILVWIAFLDRLK